LPAAPALPRFHRRPAARPEELVEAALAVFGERGFRATTLEEVAARAGVSKGTVYLYFASKDDLFRAVVEAKVVTLLASAEAMARTHAGSATELLVDVVHRMWDAMSRTDMVCMGRLVQAELTQFPEVKRFYFEQVIQRHRRLLRNIAARGVASGEFRAEATVIVPRMVPSLVMQLNQNRFLFGDLDTGAPAPAVLCDAMLTLVLHGIGKPPGRTARRNRTATAAKRAKAKGRAR
jgi:AcrR family transcriptional regulator